MKRYFFNKDTIMAKKQKMLNIPGKCKSKP